jgi:hypothetical protein
MDRVGTDSEKDQAQARALAVVAVVEAWVPWVRVLESIESENDAVLATARAVSPSL